MLPYSINLAPMQGPHQPRRRNLRANTPGMAGRQVNFPRALRTSSHRASAVRSRRGEHDQERPAAPVVITCRNGKSRSREGGHDFVLVDAVISGEVG